MAGKKTGAAKMAEIGEAEPFAQNELELDRKNPRLGELDIPTSATERDVIKTLWDKMAVAEIALSIAENGFFQFEPLFVAKEGGKNIVIEGNRRLAAVRVLLDDDLREHVGASIAKPTAAIRKQLETLPVIFCKREQVWEFLGFKHVNGAQAWESYAKGPNQSAIPV